MSYTLIYYVNVFYLSLQIICFQVILCINFLKIYKFIYFFFLSFKREQIYIAIDKYLIHITW